MALTSLKGSRPFFALILIGIGILVLMMISVMKSDRLYAVTIGEKREIATRAASVKRGVSNMPKLDPGGIQKKLEQFRSPDIEIKGAVTPRIRQVPKGGVWGQSCPTWSPSSDATRNESSPLDDQKASEVALLSQILRARLQLPNDIVMPNFTVPCDEIAKDKNRYLKACTTTNCPNPLSKNLEERVKDVLTSPELQLTMEDRQAIDVISQQIPENDVIIVTAASSNHWGEAQKMFKTLHEIVYPALTNFTVVFMDIGLSDRERKLTEQNCRCTVVQFPYKWFPPHVKVPTCYSFKPISVLAAARRARRLVVWMDSSVRWTSGFKHIFQRAERYGTQIIRYPGSARITAHTHRSPFDYMKKDVCAFTAFPEIEACAQVHTQDAVSLKLILEPWAKCALERCCICPVSPGPVLPCTKHIGLHRCHRFDQSALSMVMARLLDDQFQKFVMPDRYNDQPIIYKLGGDVLMNYF